MSGDESPENDAAKKSQKFGQRHIQTVLFFVGVTFCYTLRSNISAAIVPLTDYNGNSSDDSPTYAWDPSTKSVILSSFFWGYVAAQIPAGLLSKRFGPRIVLGLGTVICSVLTILHPIAISFGGWKLLCAFRVFTGLTQGVLFPCVHTLLVKWVPYTERGFLSTTVYSGAQLGVAIILATSGQIFHWMGWQGIFYISGGISLLWSLIFLCFGADEPAQSKYITKLEREYIESLTSSSNTGNEQLPVPWKDILTSLPFLALIVAQCGFTWGFYTLLTQLPTYMSNVLQFDIKSDAFFSALPYLAMWISGFFISPISDFLVNRHIISAAVSRKLFNSIGEWIPMACLIILAYMTVEQKVLAIVLLTVAMSFIAGTYCGFLINHMDLAPNFAGVLISISNGSSNLCSIIAPLVVGVIVKNEKDPAEWRTVFFIAAGVYFFCNLFFVIFGKVTVQSWNEPSASRKIVSTKNKSRKELKDTSLNMRTIESADNNMKSA